MKRNRIKSNTTTIDERVHLNEEEIKVAWDKKIKLLRKCIELENAILGIENMVLHKGRTKFEMLYGKLSSNATKDEMVVYDRRRTQIKTMSKKPYNQYYVEQLKKTKQMIKRVQKERQHAYDRKEFERINIAKEDSEYPSIEIMGKPFGALTASEIAEYVRIVTRAKEERRKMELGVPPYDKLKKS